MKDKIVWVEFNRGDDSTIRHSEPKIMSREEVIEAASEWYDAIGTGLNDFDGIQFVRVKESETSNREGK